MLRWEMCSNSWPVPAGDPDTPVIESFERERRFFEFVEGRSKAGKTSIYGSEDSWWADL